MSMVLSYIQPIQSMLIVLSILLIFEIVILLITKYQLKKNIEYPIIKKISAKFLVYLLSIISANLVEVYLIDKVIPATKMISGLLGIVQLVAILQKLNVIYGSNLFTSIIKKITKTTGVEEESYSSPVSPSNNSSSELSTNASSSVEAKLESFKRSKLTKSSK